MYFITCMRWNVLYCSPSFLRVCSSHSPSVLLLVKNTFPGIICYVMQWRATGFCVVCIDNRGVYYRGRRIWGTRTCTGAWYVCVCGVCVCVCVFVCAYLCACMCILICMYAHMHAGRVRQWSIFKPTGHLHNQTHYLYNQTRSRYVYVLTCC